MSDSAVRALATAAGLLVDWEDAAGEPQTVSPESLRTILSALGLPADSDRVCADSAAQLAADLRAERIDFLTADLGIATPLAMLAGPARLTPEDGTGYDIVLDGGVPAIETPGYHRLDWRGGSLTIAVAPPRCHPVPPVATARRWGTAVQLYALRDAGGSVSGDFGTLAGFMRDAGAAGADAVAISPVHALFPADPLRFSPYSPSSRRFLNPLYADVPTPGDDGTLIDWPAAATARYAALAAAYRREAADPEFSCYADTASPDLRAHALFEALHGHFFERDRAAGWQDWPTDFQDPSSPAVAAFAAEQADRVRYHLFLQWRTERALAAAGRAAADAGMAIGMIADIAVGLDPGGSHGWSRRDELMMDIGIGAPPDAYQAAGQDWGITSFAPQALRRNGFAPFIAMLRAAMRGAGGVRIDHALGLRRLWVVPRGATPLDGAYLRNPERDLLRLIALESHRAKAIVIGEDLGVVPPGFRDMIAVRGIYGMRVLPFERDRTGFTPPAGWGAQAVAMTSTHDMVPIAGWWRGRDIDWRERIEPGTDGDGERAERAIDRTRLWDACCASGSAAGAPPAADDPVPALDAAITHSAGAPCDLLIVPAEDLFGMEEAPNLPGTIDQHPNWRRRLVAPGEALFARPDVRHRIAAIIEARDP